MKNKKAVGLLLDHMGKAETKSKAKSFRGPTPHKAEPRAAQFTLSYLDAFGYLKDELANWKVISIGDIIDALKQFQGMFGMPKTGNVYVKTIRAMQAPRCGCPDIERKHHKGMQQLKAFAKAALPRWQKTGVTYSIADYLPGIAKQDFDTIIYNAFQNWCRLGNIEVNQTVNGIADILISNGRGAQSNFDGPGGVLAWAYMPDGSDQQLLMRFDLDETWVLSAAQRGTLVANVACHEFGHLLGLSHSNVQSALMAPYYNAAIATPQQSDDIPRFQARYGVRSDGQPTVPPVGALASLLVTGTFAGVKLNGNTIA